MSYVSRSRRGRGLALGWSWDAWRAVFGRARRCMPCPPIAPTTSPSLPAWWIRKWKRCFFLDAQTGMLRAAVPALRQPGGFQSVWEANPVADLASVVAKVNVTIRSQNSSRKGGAGAAVPEIQVPANPKFMMVTATGDIRQGPSRARPGQALVYLAEANTGVILAYALPWNPTAHVANQPFRQPMILWAADKLATAIVPTEE